MKLLPQLALDELKGQAPVLAGAYRLALPSGIYRLWSGFGNISIEDEIYLGIGARALMTPISSQVGGAADGLTITLSALDPDVAASILLEDYHQKPVVIWRVIFNAIGTTILGASVFMRGRLDYVVIRETIGGEAALDFFIEGPRRDLNRSGSRIRSDSDQRVLGGSGDGSMKHITTAGQKTLTWGNKPDKPFSTQPGDATDRSKPHVV